MFSATSQCVKSYRSLFKFTFNKIVFFISILGKRNTVWQHNIIFTNALSGDVNDFTFLFDIKSSVWSCEKSERLWVFYFSFNLDMLLILTDSFVCLLSYKKNDRELSVHFIVCTILIVLSTLFFFFTLF